MKWIKTHRIYSPFSLTTRIERDGQPWFFKHDLPFYNFKDQVELDLSVSVYNKFGEYISETEYIVSGDLEAQTITLYHNLVDQTMMPYRVKYVMYPKTIALEHEFFLNNFRAQQLEREAEVDGNSITFEEDVYVTQDPFRKGLYELLYKNSSYSPAKYCFEDGCFPEQGLTQRTYTPKRFVTAVVPKRLDEHLYRIDTRFLTRVYDSDVEVWNNMGYFESLIEKKSIVAEFSVYGQLLEDDYRYTQSTETFGGKSYYLSSPKMDRTEVTKSAGLSNGELDYIPFDSMAPFEAGNINRVFTVDDLEKQLLSTDKAIINNFKTAGIPEINVDFAFNIITPDYIGRTTNELAPVTDYAETEMSRILDDTQEVTAEAEVDYTAEPTSDKVGMKVNKVLNPGLLDLFVLDRSLLDKDEDYKEEFLWR
jgi:hypothetical protein